MDIEKSLSHAAIIIGPEEDTGKAAREKAAGLLCSSERERPCGVCRNCLKVAHGSHPDLITVERQTDDKGKLRREIYVDQIRQIVASSAVMPNEAERKVYVIKEADLMNTAAQNALLKILEEPPEYVSFLLLAQSGAGFLETVRSRCVTLNLAGAGTEPSAEAAGAAKEYLDLAESGDEFALAAFAKGCEDMPAAEAQDFVRAAEARIVDMLSGRVATGLSGEELLRIHALMERAGEYLGYNVSSKHLFGLIAVRTILK